eukprot:4799351-Pyramimonas_sp.AAC.1
MYGAKSKTKRGELNVNIGFLIPRDGHIRGECMDTKPNCTVRARTLAPRRARAMQLACGLYKVDDVKSKTQWGKPNVNN